MTTWEYKVNMLISSLAVGEPEHLELMAKELNRIGAKGWELVTFLPSNETPRLALFKRQSRDKSNS